MPHICSSASSRYRIQLPRLRPLSRIAFSVELCLVCGSNENVRLGQREMMAMHTHRPFFQHVVHEIGA